MTLPATLYARYSSLEQAKGNSLQRQFEIGREFALRNGWVHTPEREIADEARSAFHGANRSEGSGLYEFERQAEQGLFANGHVLVVEHLDRITRKGWEDAYDFVKRLTGFGVTVATVDGGRIFNPHERVPMGVIMEIIVKSELAWEESEKKSKRQLASWKAKVERAQAGDRTAITRLTPAWIEVDEKRQFVLNDYRVNVLKEIYEWSVAGMGTPAIARRLNERGEPTWGMKKAKANSWQIGYLTRLLTNRAVLGEYQPMRRSRSASFATIKGSVIPNYYPQAIDTDLFNRSQAARETRKGRGGRIGKTQANLFTGLAKCAECGGRMAYGGTRKAGQVINGTSGSRKPITFITKTDHSFLQCDNARRSVTADGKRVCLNISKVRYQYLEPAVLDNLLHLALDQSHFAQADKVALLRSELAEHERQLEGKEARLHNLVDTLGRTGSRAVESQMLELEAEVEADKARTEALQASLTREQGHVSPEEHLKRVHEIRASLNATDPEVKLEARVRVAQALRGIITHMTCYPDKRTYVHGLLTSFKVDAKGNVSGVSVFKQAADNRDDLPSDALIQLERHERKQNEAL